MRYLWKVLLLTAVVSSCQQGIDLSGFDEQNFREDPNGCSGKRAAQKQQLFDVASQLKGLTQAQLSATLGKPDRQDLAGRSQKYFVYFIEPAPECSGKSLQQEPLTMFIRFSAVDRSTEVSFQNF